jgi:WD40 repeat protein/serine/threonine protein kinase
MNGSLFPPSDDEKILANFVAALEKDGPAAIDAFAVRHPLLADEFRSLAAMGHLFHQSRADAEPTMPEHLGEFRIVRRIGRGGMGEIYEAVQDRLKRRVAVKVIRHGKISPDSGARFLREQTILARLHQTHIVPIHTAGEHGPLQYFAMPYIEGATLSEAIQAAREQQTSAPRSKTPPLGAIAGKLAADSRQRAWPPAPTLASPVPPAASTGDVQQPTPDTPLSDKTATISIAPTARFTLSMEYFRSAAQVLADAALALHHAHAVQILHRDVKPSNIMVDKSGQCWIIDFGLAGYVNQTRDFTPNEETIDFQPEPITSAHIKGTLQYMAPEQFDGQGDVRTDVWGLGVTLYELCTLRRAFEGRGQHEISRKIQSEEPTWPRQLVPNLPADLAAICRKAIHKDAARRYQTSDAFAVDPNRWLRSEPVQARPSSPFRRAWLWSKRNKGWAAAIGVSLALWISVAGGMAAFYLQKADIADAKSKTAEAETKAAKEEAAARQRQFVMQIEAIRLLPHVASSQNLGIGWSDNAWDLVKKAAESGPDDMLRDRAAATLAGLDARCKKVFNFEAGSVAFDADGERLLMGGTYAQEAKLWNPIGDALSQSGFQGFGPVMFRSDGTAVQFVHKEDDARVLLVWDVTSRKALKELTFPEGVKLAVRFALQDWVMTPTGSYFAVAATMENGSRMVHVWDKNSSKSIHQFPGEFATLAFSPDGTRLAGGTEDGRISIWSLLDWRELNSFALHRASVRCLAFSPDSSRLAAGDSLANVTIWNTERSFPPVACRGSRDEVYALAFSPDGTIVASGGRGACKFWDPANGRLLLDLETGDFVTGLTFSPDGRRLAVSSQKAFSPGQVHLWDLDYGRGIQTLRGFAAPVGGVCYSADGRFLACLSHDWQIGIWDLPTGQFHLTFEVPRGFTTDNAGLAFSPDGNRFAFSSGTSAKLWETSKGKELDSWKLPPGLVDLMSFQADGKLLLFRIETTSGKVAPQDRSVKSEDDPRVGRIRDLLGPTREKPIAQLTPYPKGVANGVGWADGRQLILEVVHSGPEKKLKAFDGLTGKELWLVPDVYDTGGGSPRIDPTGKFVSFDGKDVAAYVFDIPSQSLATLENLSRALGPGASYYFGRPLGYPTQNGMLLFRRGRTEPLITLGIDFSDFNSKFPQFNIAGTQLAWGNSDGTVTVCDLPEINRRLKEVGLGWQE